MTTTEPAHEPQAQDSGRRAGVPPSRSADAVPEGRGRPTAWTAALWLLAAAALALALVIPLTGKAANGMVLLLVVPFSLIHGVRRYGAKCCSSYSPRRSW